MRVSTWGGSLAVRLPKDLVRRMGIAAGDEVAIVEASGSKLGLAKVAPGEEFSARMQRFRWPVAPDYRFDRNEANER